jgi:hypothetical protein
MHLSLRSSRSPEYWWLFASDYNFSRKSWSAAAGRATVSCPQLGSGTAGATMIGWSVVMPPPTTTTTTTTTITSGLCHTGRPQGGVAGNLRWCVGAEAVTPEAAVCCPWAT